MKTKPKRCEGCNLYHKKTEWACSDVEKRVIDDDRVKLKKAIQDLLDRAEVIVPQHLKTRMREFAGTALTRKIYGR